MKRFGYIVWLMALVLGWCNAVSAQTNAKQLREVTTTEGREFFVTWMPNGGSTPTDQDLILQLLASSRKDNSITIEYPNGSTTTHIIPAGQTTVIPIDAPTVYWDPAKDEEEKPLYKGLRVYSNVDELFTLYSINQMGVLGSCSFDGAHIIPVEALGNEYIVTTAKGDATATEFVVMSTRPGATNVTIHLTVNSRRGNTQDLSFSLNGSKQIYIVRSKAPNSDDPNDLIDLTGSTICADQPIAVWSGNQYAIIPNKGGYSNDHAYDQLLPLKKWGKSFIIPLTGLHTQYNEIHVSAIYDNTTFTVTNRRGTTSYPLSAAEDSILVISAPLGGNQDNNTQYITSDKPIQVYMFSSSGAANPYDDEDEVRHLQGDPAMTIIPPLEYLTDTTIFSTYNGGDGALVHEMKLWALTSEVNNIRLDNNSIASSFTPIAFAPGYSQAKISLVHGTHTIIAPKKCFSGFVYGMDQGQAYLYPVGYDFTPKKDSLFLLDNENQYDVHKYDGSTPVWKANAVSATEGGWHLEKVRQDDNTYKLDSVYVCDSTILKFPIVTYSTWFKVRWEIEGSIQGPRYFRPQEQVASTVPRPELEHQFHLLPIEQNQEPFEDFEVRGILIHKPIFCENIPEDKWERDTFNTVVRVLRQYNDTTWRAICLGDTVQFFRDTVWDVNPATISGKPVEGTHFHLQTSVFNADINDPATAYYKYGMGVNPITRSYLSSAGCDSLSTLMIYVCAPHYAERDTIVCQDGTRGLDYGDFFLKYKRDNSWPKTDTVMYDTLRATACMHDPEWDAFAPHCPDFNGCDSVLQLHLNVKPVTRNTKRHNQCLSQGTIFEWKEDKSERLIHTFSADTMKMDSTYTFRDYVKYTDCEGCLPGPCDSVRNTLYLTFVTDGGQAHVIHICQGKDTTYRNSSNTQATKYFTSQGKLCNTEYKEELKVQIIGYEDGQMKVYCEFTDTLKFYVDTVYKDQMTYDTICWDPSSTDQTYTWAGHPNVAPIPITGAGLITKQDIMKTARCGEGGNCDSICVLQLRVGRPYFTPTTKEICDNDSVSWQDTIFYGPKFTGTLPTGKQSKKITTATYTSSYKTLSQYKCDSTLTFSLTVHPTYMAVNKDTSVCANEPYDFYGTIYNVPDAPEVWEPGHTYTLEIHDESIHHCDSMVRHTVTVYPYYPNEKETNDTVCQVLSETPVYYEWPGAAHAAWNDKHLQKLNNAGTFSLVDYLKTVHGCDSTIHRTLVIMPSYSITVPRMMSSEDTVQWEGRIYAGEKAVFDNPDGKEVIICSGYKEVVDVLPTTKIGTHTCDSTRTLQLKVGQLFRDTMYDAACANCGTYNWVIKSPITGEDTTIYITELPAPYQTKTYYDSLKTALDYDSIYVLRLTAYPNYMYDDDDEICQGKEYLWADHMPVTGGVQHRLFVNGESVTEIPTGEHGLVEVVDSMMTDTVYTNPKTGITKTIRCDSVWTLHLTVHPTYSDQYVELMEQKSLASNDTLSYFETPHTLFVGYDFDYEAAGVTLDDLKLLYDSVICINRSEGTLHIDSTIGKSVYGCDSVHYVQINICEVKYTQLVDSIADNDTIWHFGGDTEAREHTLPLITGHHFHNYDDGTPVKYDSAINRTVREYLYIDTLRTANGCDSIVHDSVYVFPSYRFEFDTAVCSNKTYYWYGHGTIKYNERGTGVYYDSVNYTVGTHVFDSVYVLGLDVMPAGYWEYDTTLCMNDTIRWHYQDVYYRPGGLQYVEVSYQTESSPCGEIHHMNLMFMPFYGATMIEYDTICQNDAYAWISPNETKEHKEALCDGSGNKLESIPTDEIGDFLYYDSLKTVSCGCDSVYTLYLHIDPSYRFYTDTTICTGDVFDWVLKDRYGNDSVVSYSSDVTTHLYDTLKSETATLCDSSYYLHVFVDQPYEIHIDTMLCAANEHFTWNDVVYDDLIAASATWQEAREYFDTIREHTLRGRCDSLIMLHLTIAPSGDSIWTDSMCIGETYLFFDQELTEPGIYETHKENAWGCDTKYQLDLRHIPATVFQLEIDPVCYDEQGIATSYTVHYTYEGVSAPVSYSIRYDSVAQSIGFEDEEDIPLDGASVIALPVPDMGPGTYPRPGYYDAVIAFKNGVCLSDSLMRYPFKMEMRYPSWIMEQRHNDVIALLSENYNNGYTWSAYQWYENDRKLEGQTKPYLHVPTGLTRNAEYTVALTRTDDEVTMFTCPLIAQSKSDDFAPTMGYLSVTPTCVVTAHPIVSILSRHDGTYRVTTSDGTAVSDGVFRADVTEITLPDVEGLYIVQLWSEDTPEEPYRAIKVLVSKLCPNCDTSSF